MPKKSMSFCLCWLEKVIVGLRKCCGGGLCFSLEFEIRVFRLDFANFSVGQLATSSFTACLLLCPEFGRRNWGVFQQLWFDSFSVWAFRNHYLSCGNLKTISLIFWYQLVWPGKCSTFKEDLPIFIHVMVAERLENCQKWMFLEAGHHAATGFSLFRG